MGRFRRFRRLKHGYILFIAIQCWYFFFLVLPIWRLLLLQNLVLATCLPSIHEYRLGNHDFDNISLHKTSIGFCIAIFVDGRRNDGR